MKIYKISANRKKKKNANIHYPFETQNNNHERSRKIPSNRRVSSPINFEKTYSKHFEILSRREFPNRTRKNEIRELDGEYPANNNSIYRIFHGIGTEEKARHGLSKVHSYVTSKPDKEVDTGIYRFQMRAE